MKRYHIHITSEDVKAPKGFKLTSVILEKRKIIQKHNMFTRTYIGTDNVQNDINTIIGEFKNKFSKLPELGKIYIDEDLKKVPLPFAIRSINTSVKTYVRGTRIPFNPDAKVIRPFIHWFDEFGYEDLDLSAGFYTKGLKQVTHISYTNLKNEMINSCFAFYFHNCWI